MLQAFQPHLAVAGFRTSEKTGKEARVLCSTVIASRLRAETFVHHVELHGELPSTNDRALELAVDQGVPTPAIVLTERQTSGRGRGGNIWQSGPGALTFSLLIDRPQALMAERAPLLSLVAGLAVRDAVAAVARGHVVQVKWPNDVYLDGRKVCGILIEIPSAAANRMAIGIGVNVNNDFAGAPADLRQRAVSVSEVLGRPADMAETLVSLLIRLEAELTALAATGGLPMGRWAAHCLLTGREVVLKTPGGEFAGHCLGISEEGSLLLDGPDGPQAFRGGEIVSF